MNWFNDFYHNIAKTPLAEWLNVLPSQLHSWHKQPHGELKKWLKLLQKLPPTQPSGWDLDTGVRIGSARDISDYQQKQIRGLLQLLMPWRKGPYFIHDIHLDCEWRSDWKWQRLAPHIRPLQDQLVLDIGCGNGYHMWRMLAQNPQLVVGIDPTALFLMQFHAIKHFKPDPRIHLLPIGVDDLPKLQQFDTVFSMGVLYHRKSPMDFLQQLKWQLRPGGQLILETLVVDGDARIVLVPQGRYAQMGNVWFLPSCDALTLWLERLGFSQIVTVDVASTTTAEQRATAWMTGQSLSDFLDPNDASLTIEGYPAPKRAVIIASA